MVSIFGLVRGGLEERFSPSLVALEKAHLPQIPFVNCDNRPVDTYSSLGRADAKSTELLWGNSHLLAWAPELNANINRQNVCAASAAVRFA